MGDDETKHADPDTDVQRSNDEENVPADSDLTVSSLLTAGVPPTNTQETGRVEHQELSKKELVQITGDPIELVVKYYNVPTTSYDAVQLNLTEVYESDSEPEKMSVELTTKRDILGSPEETSTLSARNENTSEIRLSLSTETISSEAVHLNVPVTEQMEGVSKELVGNEKLSSSEISKEVLPNFEKTFPLQVTSNEAAQSRSTFRQDYGMAGSSGVKITRIDESSSSSSNGADVVVTPLSPSIGILHALNNTVMKLCRIGRLIQLYSSDTMRINFNDDLTRINTIIDCYSTALFSNTNMQSRLGDGLKSQKSSVRKYRRNRENQNIPQQSKCDDLKLLPTLSSKSNTKIGCVEPRYPDLSTFPSNTNRQRLEEMARYKSDSALSKNNEDSNLRQTRSLPNEIFVRRDRRSYLAQRDNLNYYDASTYERALISKKQKLENFDYQDYRRFRDYVMGRYENRPHRPAPRNAAMYLPDNMGPSGMPSTAENSSVPMSSHVSSTRHAERLTRPDMELRGAYGHMKSSDNLRVYPVCEYIAKRKDSEKVDYGSDDCVDLPFENEPSALDPIFLELPVSPPPVRDYQRYEEERKVSCPICWDIFPYSEIQEHAAACTAYIEEEGACGGS